ncbi:hypothetical protein CUMW_002160, partial [Citrus unshiu]
AESTRSPTSEIPISPQSTVNRLFLSSVTISLRTCDSNGDLTIPHEIFNNRFALRAGTFRPLIVAPPKHTIFNSEGSKAK